MKLPYSALLLTAAMFKTGVNASQMATKESEQCSGYDNEDFMFDTDLVATSNYKTVTSSSNYDNIYSGPNDINIPVGSITSSE